jgi:hypothetical protein
MKRRHFLQTLATATPMAGAPPAIEIGGRKQLFFDSRFLEQSRGVKRVTNPPVRRQPVLFPAREWESTHIGSYLSVLDDEGTYKLWYMSFAGKGLPRLCYATSTDGVNWERPELGLVEYRGSAATNIVIAPFREGCVMRDPAAPPSRRYKTLMSLGGKGGTLRVLASGDGLHWKEEYPVLPFHADSMNVLFWDERIRKYAAYLRGWNPLRVVLRTEIEREGVLLPWSHGTAEHALELWGANSPPALSTEFPTVLRSDERDPEPCDIYTPNVQLYPWAQDAYFAFPSIFRHTKRGTERIPLSGVVEVQLAVSRDGIRFDRMDRRPYVGLGVEGEADSRNAYMGYGMIRRGDEIYMYYGGGAADHGAPLVMPGGKPAASALFLAVQRLDGFVSMDADEAGEIITPLLRFEGHELQLNVDTGAMGSIAVEMQDTEGRPVEGFTEADCERITGNDVGRVVQWKGSDVGVMQGRAVRLRFVMRRTKLFAFQFG